MAISDLTGTTWVLNSTAVGTDAFSYSVNVLFDGTIYSYFVGKYSAGYDCYLYGVANSATVNPVHILSQFGGSTSIVETGSIKFLGGSAVTNATLIAWLEANAEQITYISSVNTNNRNYLIKDDEARNTLASISLPTPTISDAGKVIGVNSSGQYVLVEGGGGGTPYDGSYSIEPLITTIEFSVYFTSSNTQTYTADENMTWSEWVASSYNTAGFAVLYNNITISDAYIFSNNGNTMVLTTDTIISGHLYYAIQGGG